VQSERYGTRIIENPEKIIEQIRNFTLTSNELSVSFASGGMQFNYDYFFEEKKKVMDKHRRGAHKGIRYISFIDKDNIDAAKKFLDAGVKIKHVRNLPPMSFGISDKQMITTLEKMEGGKVAQSILVSTDVTYIKYFAAIFDELWDKGINAIERIKDIEEGRETDDGLADAKQYLGLVLEEVSKMKNKAEQQKKKQRDSVQTAKNN
jgi:two-component system, OmpR family, sensor histidine kinase VicK